MSDPFCPQLQNSAFYFDSRLHAGAACASASADLKFEIEEQSACAGGIRHALQEPRDYPLPNAIGRPTIFNTARTSLPDAKACNLVKSLPPTLKYEPGTILADGDFVVVPGRFSNFGLPVNWIAADILRIENGTLVEHWDVIQDEAARQSSKSGLPMFGETFALAAGA